ncbi:hypothetical protein CSU72_04275 [Salmonella enterica subsp. enterica serovar Infantis]|nr:hypothetical protein [Salmonella enterica subsp. enterica serovar Infantis]
MKKHDASMIKKGILLSLVLLSPEILAATENLNFNYTRADASSLDPRLGIQARACHSKADPVNIRILFEPMMIGFGDYNVRLVVNGAPYAKSYAVFNNAVSVNKNAGVDPDFLVPWRVDAKGSAKGASVYNAIFPSTPPGAQGRNFCFEHGYRGGKRTFGYKPLIDDGTTTSQYYAVCRNKPKFIDLDHSWEGNIETAPAPPVLKAQYDKQGYSFLEASVFFEHYNPGTPESHQLDTEFFNSSGSVIAPETDNISSYRLPLGNDNNVAVTIDSGDFLFTLGNRNISSLSLIVSYRGGSDVWRWAPAQDDPVKNVLHLTFKSDFGTQPAATGKNLDVYSASGFYVANYSGGFRGTLATENSLSDVYRNYIDKIMPLSLPAKNGGDLNLANTESLTITLGKKPGQDGAGSMTFSVYGQPLKFSPLYLDNKEVISARKLRDACY